MIPRVVLNLARQLAWSWLIGPSLVWAAERPTVSIDFEGVERITLKGTTLILHERRANSPRQFKIEAGKEFWP